MNSILIKPDFIIAGAPKAGTSSLIRYLEMSPEISCVATLKDGSEPHFFSKNFPKGFQWYSNLFDHFPTENIKGEKSVSYMIDPSSAQRISDYCPNVKLIFLLRNPIKRAYSQYKANIQRGTEFLSFENAVKMEKFRTRFFKNNYAYIKRGHYAELLKPYFDLFPGENMLFLLSEKLLKNPVDTMDLIYKFLGVNSKDIHIQAFGNKYNVSRRPRFLLLGLMVMVHNRFIKRKLKLNFLDKWFFRLERFNLREDAFPSIKKETFDKLNDYFRPLNEELSALTGLDTSAWHR